MAVKKGYKQTEVGVIPEGWELTSLQSVLDPSRHIRYGVVQPGEFVLQGQLMLRSQDYSKGWMGPDEMHRISSSLEKQYRNARINSGDLIMTIVGAGIGQVVSAPDWLDGAILSRSTCRIAVDPRKAAKGYVAAFLESPFGWRQILDCQKEGAQPVVSCPDLARFIIPLPTLPEQEAIAGALSDADAWIESLEQLIAKKRQIKQGAMQELLTGKRRLPGFSGKWQKTLLGDVITHCSSGATPYRGRPDYYTGTIRWITSGELNYNVIMDTIEHISEEALANTNLKLHPTGTFLMAITGLEAAGTRGSCGIVGAPSATNQSCMAVYPNSRLTQKFLFHFYVYRGDELALKYCQGTKQQSYTASLVKLLPIDLPPTIDEQTAIATVLSDMDTEIESLESKLAKAREVKQGMMQELLTGRIRLI